MTCFRTCHIRKRDIVDGTDCVPLAAPHLLSTVARTVPNIDLATDLFHQSYSRLDVRL